MLVFPFCAYVANSLSRLRARLCSRKGHDAALIIIVIPYLILASLYTSGLISWESEWTPPNLVQSSIGVNQIDDCIACVKWLNENAVSGACLIIEERFRGWVLLYLKREDIKIAVYGAPGTRIADDFKRAYDAVVKAGFKVVYTIWYSYLELEIKDFTKIYSYGNIAIYQAELPISFSTSCTSM